MRRAISILAAVSTLSFAAAANAQSKATETLYTPSIFEYGFDGFLLGAGAGLGVGYMAARSGGWTKDDWQPLAYGAGIGALAGGALGLSLGITDMVSETPGRGYYVLKDGGLGLGFGAAAGAIAGGIAAVGSKKPEHILFGAAIGGLVGTGLGVILGIVEGNRAWHRHARGVALTLAPATEAGGSVAWIPALTGRY